MAEQKVAFLGPISSYTHQATVDSFPKSEYEHVPVTTIQDIFEAVQSGQVSRGVVPFENSTNGSVVFTLDLFADRSNLYPDLSVCGEVYLDVHHYLLGSNVRTSSLIEDTSRTTTPTPSVPNPSQPRATPLKSVKNIRRVYSHPQAFGQCEIFLNAYLKGIERIDVSSTSKAAEMVKTDTTGTSAAIASQLASEIHGLATLARGIEDKEDNTTRFFIIRKGSRDSKGLSESLAGSILPKTKSLVSFTVPHTSPGALADVLDCFKRYKLNLTSINSRPTKVTAFQYIFFVEFEGSKLDDPEARVKCALESLAKVAQTWRWLGSWEDELRQG